MLTALALAALVQDPAPEPRIEPLPIPRAAVLARGETRIVVDGSLQDWPALPPLFLDDPRQVSGTALGAYRGLGDVAGRVFLLWDDEALWVAASVLDDWHIRIDADSPRDTEIPPADALILTFDPARDTRSLGADRGRRDDISFWLAEVEGQGRQVVRWDRYRGTAGFAEGGQLVVRRDADAGQTTYEARLPWAAILPRSVRPRAGLVLDAQIVIEDYDEPTDPLAQTRVGWTFGMGPKIDPGLLGSLMLVSATADSLASGGVPKVEIPAPPSLEEPPVPPRGYWTSLHRRLQATEPAIVGVPTVDALHAGGAERHEPLAELESQLARFPRVDFLEFQHRIHRRMNRECLGIVDSGLPWFWNRVLEDVARRAAGEPPEKGFVLHRLPQGGFLVRSRQATFAIDPAGYAVDKHLADMVDFVLSTDPLEPSKRSDQLALRMIARKEDRPYFTHVALHLPGVKAEALPLVVPEREYHPVGLRVRVLGEIDEAGLVSRSVGYDVRWPDGTRMVVSGRALREEDVERGAPVDLLILSAADPRARIVGQRVAAELTVLDDVLQCATTAGPDARVTLAQAAELQVGLRPHASVILAPGDAITVE